MFYLKLFIIFQIVFIIYAKKVSNSSESIRITASIEYSQKISQDVEFIDIFNDIINLHRNNMNENKPLCSERKEYDQHFTCVSAKRCTDSENIVRDTDGVNGRGSLGSIVLNVSSTQDGSTNKYASYVYNQSPNESILFVTDATNILNSLMLHDSEKIANENSIHKSCFILYYKNQGEKNETLKPTTKYDALQVWGLGFLSVALISLSGVFGIIFVPLMKKTVFKIIMRYFVGLGVGTLSSTAIFQLIPESFELKRNSNDYLMSSLSIWMSIWIFLIFESACKIILAKEDSYTTKKKAAINSRKNSSVLFVSPSPPALEDIEHDSFLPVSYDARWQKRESGNATNTLTLNTLPGGSLATLSKKAAHHRSHDLLADGKITISSVAWMIILGDGLHNFIDGISIGAGFTESIMTGVSISIAIMCEEFPHELGDFAILINSGLSVKKAILFNFASACTAFIGLIIGILLEKFEINIYIFGFAGGLFLYISLADLVPQLNEMIDEALKKSKKSAWIILFQQNLGVLTGMIILFLLSYFSDSLKIV